MLAYLKEPAMLIDVEARQYTPKWETTEKTYREATFLIWKQTISFGVNEWQFDILKEAEDRSEHILTLFFGRAKWGNYYLKLDSLG